MYLTFDYLEIIETVNRLHLSSNSSMVNLSKFVKEEIIQVINLPLQINN